jgi:hypothetical protein
MDEDGFPEPVDFARINEDTIERVIRNWPEPGRKETRIIFKPDHQGRIKMEYYNQIRSDNGEIITEYEENYEMVPEVVTHKHVLDEFNSGSPPKAGMLGDTLEDIEAVKSQELEEEQEEETGTDEEKRAKMLYKEAEALLTAGNLQAKKK